MVRQSVAIKRYSTLYPLEKNQTELLEPAFNKIIEELDLKNKGYGKEQQTGNRQPLANMGLDDIVRGITSPGKDKESVVDANGSPAAEKETKRRKRGKKAFEENLAKYTGISEQGFAIWLPKEVKKRLELIRLNAHRNIPLRSLAAAIIMTYIEENEENLNEL